MRKVYFVLMAIVMMSYSIVGLASTPSPGYSLSYQMDNTPDIDIVSASSELAVEMSHAFVPVVGATSGYSQLQKPKNNGKTNLASSGSAFHIEDPGREPRRV